VQLKSSPNLLVRFIVLNPLVDFDSRWLSFAARWADVSSCLTFAFSFSRSSIFVCASAKSVFSLSFSSRSYPIISSESYITYARSFSDSSSVAVVFSI
jgi:hypothetical protein